MGAYIEYAKGGTDLRTKGTISCWVKRSELGREQYVWGWGENNSSDAYLRFDAADNLEMHCDGADGTFNSTQLYRDVNGWYHIVFSLDGANATANLRRRLWVNGVQIDEGKSGISAFSAAVMGWHSTQDLWIGANPRQQQSSGHQYFNGLISHFHYCSNNSYAASDFGETDSVTGEWKIKTNPSVNYGSEGFFLKMENSANMDLDSSSNNKTLTTTGTVTATQDSPSNIFCSGNPLARFGGNLNYANGNNHITGAANNWTMGAATLGASSGKYYYECKILSAGTGSGYTKVGFISDQAQSSSAGHNAVGALDGGYAFYQQNGNLEVRTDDAVISGYDGGTLGIALTNNDIMCIAVDMDNKKAYMRKNGDAWIKSANPVTGTNGLDISSDYPAGSTKMMIPAFAIYYPGTAALNFGNGYFGSTAVSSAGTNASGIGIFEFDVPTGYTALCTKGLNE